MATTFTYKIANLDRETADGYVNTAHYTINAGDGIPNICRWFNWVSRG